jgi:ABC-type Fe3+/spermidine/putrescine transport system ATPase subunit
MRRGSVEQIGTPEEIYLRPATRFVAGFVGTANLIPCEVMSPTSDGYRVLLNAHELTVRGGSDVTDQGALLLRPEKASVAAGGESDGRPQILIEGRVATCTFAGSGWRYTVNSELGQLTANLPRKAGDPGERLVLGWSPADAWLIGATQTSPEHQPAR